MAAYNSEHTICEAVNSIILNDEKILGEVLIIDDGSDDKTFKKIKLLKIKDKRIRVFKNKKNKGAGYCRNFLLKKTSYNYILSFDADNILPVKVLNKMHQVIIKKKADAVYYEKTHFFTNNVAKSVIYENKINNNYKINFNYIFKKGFLDNFLFKKKFIIKKKIFWPINHKFDTQSFGMNFLAKSGKIFFAKGTYYFHRQFYKLEKTYFEKSYAEGHYSRNIFLIFLNQFNSFNSSTQKKILKFDIFKKNLINGPNLYKLLKSLYLKKKTSIKNKNDLEFSKIFELILKNFTQKKYEIAKKNIFILRKKYKNLIGLEYLHYLCVSYQKYGINHNIDDLIDNDFKTYNRVYSLRLKIFKISNFLQNLFS